MSDSMSFLTFSVLVANPPKQLETMTNHARRREGIEYIGVEEGRRVPKSNIGLDDE